MQNTLSVILQQKRAQEFCDTSLNKSFAKCPQDSQYAHVSMAGNGERKESRLLTTDRCSRPEGHSGGWEEALFCSIWAEEFCVCSEA